VAVQHVHASIVLFENKTIKKYWCFFKFNLNVLAALRTVVPRIQPSSKAGAAKQSRRRYGSPQGFSRRAMMGLKPPLSRHREATNFLSFVFFCPSQHPDDRKKNMSTIPVIETSALQASDVLLSYGDGTISDIIRLIDGGHYSHGAVFDGGCN
jgi:hypothetical protein